MPKVYNKHTTFPPRSAVYVGRPSVWGNPFTVRVSGRGRALKLYREWIMEPEQEELRLNIRHHLRGKDLVCWCAPKPCHADILIEIANG